MEKAEGVVTIPKNVYSMGMGIKTLRVYQEGYMLFDDMSWCPKGPDRTYLPSRKLPAI